MKVTDLFPYGPALRGEETRAAKYLPHDASGDVRVGSPSDEIIGNSAQIQLIEQLIHRVAGSEATVLITGETGTGKELLARRLHSASHRKNRALVSVNCAAIPDTLIESELFGFERGAFTGAVSRQEGRVAQAHGGTLFLDEIGDLSLPAQAKLLRVVEQKEVRPLGSRTAQVIDVRVVAATNRDLEQLIAQNKFREDLFFRLNVIRVHVPPLRERPEDIPLIAAHFLRILSLQYQRPPITLTAGAARYLTQHPWIGNARELRNAMERLFVLSASESISQQEIEDICHQVHCWRTGQARESPTIFRSGPNDHPEYRKADTGYSPHDIPGSQSAEVEQLRRALDDTKWNKSKAAQLLNCSRMTIYRKVARYSLEPSPLAPETEYSS